jgi:hypothetical protein
MATARLRGVDNAGRAAGPTERPKAIGAVSCVCCFARDNLRDGAALRWLAELRGLDPAVSPPPPPLPHTNRGKHTPPACSGSFIYPIIFSAAISGV